MTRDWTGAEQRAIINYYTNIGLTCAEIARRFSVKHDLIAKDLKEWGVEVVNASKKGNTLFDDYYTNIDSQDKAYYYGLMQAKCKITITRKHANKIDIYLPEEAIEILKNLRVVMGTGASFRYLKNEKIKHGEFGFQVRSDRMVEDLSEPREYLLDSEYAKSYLRGALDGRAQYAKDGTLTLSWRADSMAKKIVETINNLFGLEHRAPIRAKGYTHYTWGADEAERIYNGLYIKGVNSVMIDLRKELKI